MIRKFVAKVMDVRKLQWDGECRPKVKKRSPAAGLFSR
jgi:hypothetical protein